jgi:hypothetical protein
MASRNLMTFRGVCRTLVIPFREERMSEVARLVRTALVFLVALSCWTSGCSTPAAPSETTLAGTVVRGPVQPVCRVDLPCDAPFSATFAVRQGERIVAGFRSDSAGHFDVRLGPGMYLVVPGADAPIISPSAQAKEVIVGSSGPTIVTLHFDTGIR